MLLLLYMILIKVFNRVEKGIVLSIQVSFIHLFSAIYGGGQLEGWVGFSPDAWCSQVVLIEMGDGI